MPCRALRTPCAPAFVPDCVVTARRTATVSAHSRPNRVPEFHSNVASHHDHFFQVAFGEPEHAVPLLRSALPAPVADAIDWRTLTRQDPTQRGRRGRRTLCDLLFAVRTVQQQDLLLYVVLEHKSQGRRFDALQVLEQVVAVLRTHRREHPREPYLPPVLPIVLHAGARPWRSPTDVRDLFDASVDCVSATSRLSVPVVQRQRADRIRDPARKNEFVSPAPQLRNEGRAEGKVATLLRLITRAFGAPAAAVVARLHGATADELDRRTDRMLDATSLAESLAD